MSLINSILGQRIILVMIGIALFIFLVAMGINFVVAFRTGMKRRAKRQRIEKARKLAMKKARARARAAQLAALESDRNVPTLPTLAEELGEAMVEETIFEIDPTALTSADVAPPIMSAAALPTVPTPSAQVLPTLQTQALGAAPVDVQQKEGSEKSAEIQSMLADIFADVATDGRYDLLLGDTKPVEVEDLLTQLNRVARQLGVEVDDNDESGRLEQKTSRAS